MWSFQLIETVGQFKKIEREIPQPRKEEVLIRFKAASINARDAGIITGHYPVTYPRIPLSDGAGVIEAIGSQVNDYAVGDAVISCFYPFWESGEANLDNHRASLGLETDGILSEFYCLPASAIVPMPRHLSFAEAATLPCAALTAWSALMTKGRLRPGEHVLIQGTGGVAIFTLQLAKLLGAEVTVISSSDERLQRVEKMGADHLVNYITQPKWSEAVLEKTNGKGVDLVVELGGGETLSQSLKSVKVGGRISLIGVLTGVNASISIADILFRHVQINGITVGHRQDFLALNKMLEYTQIRPVIEKSYSLNQIKDAYIQMAKGGHFGKLVIRDRD